MRKQQSGQVLLAGVIMITLLLICILYMFDLHNVIRAKLKSETAQQAAALTGAAWQKKSLNLIGEINLFKACAVLLEGEENWNTPLPGKKNTAAGVPVSPAPPADPAEDLRQALQGRIDLLTQMQTRIAFIGPLAGFAAAQQSAKANGMPAAGRSALYGYIDRVERDYRYQEQFGGAKNVIGNYQWKEPYVFLLREIAERGVSVYPNVRTAGAPIVYPPELAMQGFYDDIRRHGTEIAGGDPPEQSSWRDTLYRFAKYYRQWNDSTLRDKWWNIDYTLNRFPEESEIFTLGVRNGFSPHSGFAAYEDHNYAIGQTLKAQFEPAGGGLKDKVYFALPDLPEGVDMKWFCYDESWYPQFYRQASSDYDSEHYQYWFGKNALRRSVKQEYRYEGPAAYVEGTDVYVERMVRQRASGRSGRLSSIGRRSTIVGPKSQSRSEDESYGTGYRPGAIAKTLGSLEQSNPPIAIPLVLPVFNKVVLMPTYMPIPYNFSVLRNYSSALDIFLNYLAGEESLVSLKRNPPAGTEEYLEALLMLLERKTFLNYGYNPGCTVELNLEKLRKWSEIREEHLYTQKNLSGLGWLQEPKLCTEYPDAAVRRSSSEIRVTDYINGGFALRIYPGSLKSTQYYVIDSNGKVITNDDLDPTILYNKIQGFPGGGGFGIPPTGPDIRKGPARL